MINAIKNKVEEKQFNPGITGVFINPFFIARKNLYKNIKDLGRHISGKTLDVGCGTKPYKACFSSTVYIGLEYDTGIDKDKKKAEYYYSGDKFPFQDQQFDSVVTNQVLEHVFNPVEFIKEINRVLKLEGKLLLTVPFVWDEHEQPYDFGRYSSFGLIHLLEKNGFHIIEFRKSVNNIGVIFQLLNGYVYKKIRSVKMLKQLVTVFIMAPVTLVGIFFSKILPANNDLYLDNIVLAKKIKNV